MWKGVGLKGGEGREGEGEGEGCEDCANGTGGCGCTTLLFFGLLLIFVGFDM